MENLLLLYDTKEKDLARDLCDLLDEINVGPITMIATSPDRGLTLDRKEKECFAGASGAIFLITPGSERLGQPFPSPSVSHEMGQAQQTFKEKPDSIIYLVDSKCNMPAIDQTARIIFDRTDIRSILSSLSQLIRNLKTATLFRTNPIPQKIESEPKKSLKEFNDDLNNQTKQILLDLSNLPDGFIDDVAFTKLLNQNYQMTVQSINLIKRELKSLTLLNHHVTGQPYFINS